MSSVRVMSLPARWSLVAVHSVRRLHLRAELLLKGLSLLLEVLQVGHRRIF